MNRFEIIDKLNESMKSKEPIIGVSIGNGRSAQQAAEGGADLLLALNAGRFRMSGIASTAAMLPFVNCNDMVYEFGHKEVLPRVNGIPVLFGACAQDPTYTHEELIEQVIHAGFDGINNFPTVSLIDGQYREFIEENNEGFAQEVDLLKKAVEKGFFTIAFVVTLEEAIQMVEADVDVLCLHFGWTYINRPNESELKPYVDQLIVKANTVFEKILEIKPTIIPMIYGGSIIRNPEVMSRFYNETLTMGYIGGSVFEVTPVENSIKDATKRFKSINLISELEKENEILKQHLMSKRGVKTVIGNSQIMKEMSDLITKVSNFDSNVLVNGENGSGKDLVVKAIHYNSNRAIHPIIKVNCAAIPKSLIESELFGHEKGAFIGADKQHIGRFESANHGTLFLDHITELDLNVQAKLLRVIQDKEFERVGGDETIHIDVRILSTSNKDIYKEIQEKKFREDLFYLLNVITVEMPPLRSHKQDIPLYVSTFMDSISEKHNKNMSVSPRVMNAFMNYDWPGNVRELKNVLERGAILCDGDVIDIQLLPTTFYGIIPIDDTVNYIKNSSMIVEKELILNELIKANWNQTKVAEKLGMTRRTLYNKIKKYTLEKNILKG
ncbi:MAG: phosphoenolpyruvate hydrolase family protein [Acholeplasmataceae bacterium]|nr:phosphoenolpyruvate hydrolase family protein [Acholeplasmataceae bacterium]